MKQIFLSIGSNLGDSIQNVEKALEKIQNLKEIAAFRASSLYFSSPVSDLFQPNYLNAACTFNTDLLPQDLFQRLCRIECDLGKVKKPKNAPRAIDIDLLLYGDLFSPDLHLTLPHPRIKERLFVLEPLLELTSHLEIPLSSKEVEVVELKKLISKLKESSTDWTKILNKK